MADTRRDQVVEQETALRLGPAVEYRVAPARLEPQADTVPREMLPPPALHLEESARSEAADDATDSTPTRPRIVFTNVRVSRSAIQMENPQVVTVPEHGGVAPRALSPPAAPATLRPPVLHLGHGDVEPPLVPPAPRLPAPLPTRNSPIVMSLLVLLGACGGILYYLFG